MERQLELPIACAETRDQAYLAELEHAVLPAAAKRVARWILEHGHPQRTDQGDRLYAVRDGTERELAKRSGIPRSTLKRGLAALSATQPDSLIWHLPDGLCLVASWICRTEAATHAVVPRAPTDDWGRITLPRRSPERPTAEAARSNLVQPGPGLVHPGPAWSRSGPGWSNLVQPAPASISAHAQVVVVEEINTNNNQPDPNAVWDLARRTWQRIHAETRYTPGTSDRERLLLLRYAWLALSSELGDAWLLASAAARPMRGDRQDPRRFFEAAAAYQAWELAAGEPPDDHERRAAKQRLRRALAAVDLPEQLRRRRATR